MKLHVGYIIIILLALLLHDGATAGDKCTPTDATSFHQTEQCTFSQAPTTQQKLIDTYQYLNKHTFCLDYVDTGKIRGCKFILLLSKHILHEHVERKCSLSETSIHILPLLLHPVDYYVFGLHKIIT